jgi:hypothetical protein
MAISGDWFAVPQPVQLVKILARVQHIHSQYNLPKITKRSPTGPTVSTSASQIPLSSSIATDLALIGFSLLPCQGEVCLLTGGVLKGLGVRPGIPRQAEAHEADQRSEPATKHQSKAKEICGRPLLCSEAQSLRLHGEWRIEHEVITGIVDREGDDVA